VGKTIVISFSTLDGVVDDPDGRDGTAHGGWAFRDGPAAVADDKFRLGSSLDEGTMLLGRVTWERFASLWPSRDSAFAQRMNAVPKRVLSRTLTSVDAWQHSSLVSGGLADEVAAGCERGDVIVAGSLGVCRQLAELDLVDEYRILVFPVLAGAGQRLVAPAAAAHRLELVGAEPTAPTALLTYRRARQ
jgi:dihydrofolate reductase